jgi:trk system potassium uptake protein TrkA
MHTNVIIFGAGRFGSALAQKLFKEGLEVMLVDKDYERIQDLANLVTSAVQCDLTDEKAVAELGINNFDVAVVAIGSDLEASIMGTLAAKEHEIPRIIAKASSFTQAKILKKLGADQVVFPELEMGERLTLSIAGSSIADYISFSDEYTIFEIKAIKPWWGKNLAELNFHHKYQMNVIAYHRDGSTIIAPMADYTIEKGDTLVLIGGTEDAAKLEQIANKLL